jgi:hypothetical protein
MPRKATSNTLSARYDVHPSVAYAHAIIANLPANTGRSLEEWLVLLEQSGPRGEKERRQWLMQQHKLGNTTAWMIAERGEGKGGEDTDPVSYLKSAAANVEALYTGPKAGLRPLHDALIALGRSLGKDVKVCPCKTIIPLYRHHVIAQIKPSTRTRIDFGLALRGAAQDPPARLIDTGGLEKGDRITHRIPITALAEIDEEVTDWLQIAYDLDAEE